MEIIRAVACFRPAAEARRPLAELIEIVEDRSCRIGLAFLKFRCHGLTDRPGPYSALNATRVVDGLNYFDVMALPLAPEHWGAGAITAAVPRACGRRSGTAGRWMRRRDPCQVAGEGEHGASPVGHGLPGLSPAAQPRTPIHRSFTASRARPHYGAFRPLAPLPGHDEAYGPGDAREPGRTLRRLGLNILSAVDHKSAITVCRDHDIDIDVLVSGLTPPFACWGVPADLRCRVFRRARRFPAVPHRQGHIAVSRSAGVGRWRMYRVEAMDSTVPLTLTSLMFRGWPLRCWGLAGSARIAPG